MNSYFLGSQKLKMFFLAAVLAAFTGTVPAYGDTIYIFKVTFEGSGTYTYASGPFACTSGGGSATDQIKVDFSWNDVFDPVYVSQDQATNPANWTTPVGQTNANATGNLTGNGTGCQPSDSYTCSGTIKAGDEAINIYASAFPGVASISFTVEAAADTGFLPGGTEALRTRGGAPNSCEAHYWKAVAEFHRLLDLLAEKNDKEKQKEAAQRTKSAIDTLIKALRINDKHAESHALLSTVYGLSIAAKPARALWLGSSSPGPCLTSQRRTTPSRRHAPRRRRSSSPIRCRCRPCTPRLTRLAPGHALPWPTRVPRRARLQPASTSFDSPRSIQNKCEGASFALGAAQSLDLAQASARASSCFHVIRNLGEHDR